jgi:OmpA-OmpF porin, OOP family
MGGFMRALFISSLITVLAVVSGCQRQDAPPAATASQAANAAPAPTAQPAGPAPIAEAPAAVAATPAPAAAPPAADFDPASVPVTTATLPPFPFFKEPEGKRSIHSGNPKWRERGFNRFGFLAGKKLVTVEGQLFRDGFNLDDASDGRRAYSALEFHRNYENAITALGGKKISETQFTDALFKANGGRDVVEKLMPDMYAGVDYEHHSYLIRTAQKEYWIHVSTGAIPLHGQLAVLERTAMAQSVGFLDAAAMKKAIDAIGRVALYINFDVDKATLRPDAQPILAEINKLLTTDAALKLSIEGHTDSTGTEERNRELSAQRARSVLGALVGLGIDPARLASKGFGHDKPIADNADEAGRAKNRRVELVKVQ